MHYDNMCDSVTDCQTLIMKYFAMTKNKFPQFDISVSASYTIYLRDPPSGDMLMCWC